MDAGDAIRCPTGRVEVADPGGERGIFRGPRRRRPALPGVMARALHPEHATEQCDRIRGPLRVEEPKPVPKVSFVKEAVAFLRILRSIWSALTSRRSCRDPCRSSLVSAPG